MRKTLFDKIWESHVVRHAGDATDVLYIDRMYIHEVTSPQAFDTLKSRGLDVFRPAQITATADHNVPTVNQHHPVPDPLSASQIQTLEVNCTRHGIDHFGLGHMYNGIVHVIGPELGLTRPGMTIVCGDSHTSTHGALGCIAFGIGTSEVAMVLASQCLLQQKPKTMRIKVEGETKSNVTAKDIILHIISKLGTAGGTGHFIEFAGSAVTGLSVEGRMTLCNMSIEMGARGGMVAPDDTTFSYLRDRLLMPRGSDYEKLVTSWRSLHTDQGATFDTEHTFRAEEIRPMITYGTNPGMAIPLDEPIPDLHSVSQQALESFRRALSYMNFTPGEKITGRKVDYVFMGSCTNGRIEDLRLFASYVKGRRKAEGVTAWIVPGSKMVERQAEEEGITGTLREAGFELRQPGCSACLAMNDDKVPEGALCISTSNRNFEGRQGPGARTLLAGPAVAAVAAVTGVVPGYIS